MPDSPAQKRMKRRVPLPGFPVKPYIMTVKQVQEYFNSSKLLCLMCGRYRANLGSHLQVHDCSVDEYKESFGLPWSRGLTGTVAANNYSAAVKERIAMGYDPSASGERLLRMQEAAKSQRYSAYKRQITIARNKNEL